MVGNLLNILVGLWLAYSAIFATPAGNMSTAALAAGGVAAVILALWARRSDAMGWQSGSNIVLGAILLATAGAHWGLGMAPLACFWVVLLAGITIANLAMWSILYRPQPAQTAHAALPERRTAAGG